MEEKQNQEQVEMVEEVTSQENVEVEAQKGDVTENIVVELEEKPVSEPKNKSKKAKKEKPQESYEGLTDDEIYTKMQTEKLVQRKKKRKIYTAVAMGFAFVLALVIIILATVPVSLKPNCIDNNYTEVRLYNGTNIDNPVATIFEEDERFDKFKKVFDKSFAQSCLAGLFSGAIFAYDIEEEHELFSVAMNELTSTNTYFVRLTYSKEHKVTKQSGKVYYSDRYANRDWAFSFTDAYITVNTESGFRDTRVYIPVTYPDSENGEYAIVITVKSNTSKIRDAWSDFVAD